MSAPSRTALIAAFAAIYLIWGSTYLGIRIAVESMPAFLMASSRFIIAGGIVAAFIALTRGFRATPKQWRDNAIIGGFLCLGGNGLVSWAEEKVPSGIATLIISAGPVFIVLMDWAVHTWSKDGSRGTRPNALTFAGLALGFIGLAILVAPDVMATGVGSLDPWRLLGLLGATFFWGVGMMIMRYTRDPAEPFTASGIQMICGSGWLLLASFATGELGRFDPALITSRSVLAWAYLVVFGSLIGFSTFTWLMKHSTPARVSTYAYVNPVVAVFLGWLVLHEPLSPRLFLAATIIIAGVALITIAKTKKTLANPPRPAVAALAASGKAE
ncbi:putative inner membrane transporter YedA [Lacunisphaera limnophila]|uniref:Putative inner membrane transporter YedA n=1 Tax=Lacunisphaera limnophila TaxID=1838286 RepID=A0A1D8AS72_9BACT|nr:EamA family transporter [Lacunisphaera limnophila]AOS43745.1 putative inner membrane transporter YedA [Lacunisphaera limnophila]